jgi:hypothetical protein
MRTISLDATPNQELSVTLDGNRWDITIKECNGVMCCTLLLNDVLLLSGQRIVGGSPLIPYKYMQGAGNFWILTENDELPDYNRFGVDQQFIYISAAESAAIPSILLDWDAVQEFIIDGLVINPLAFVIGT